MSEPMDLRPRVLVVVDQLRRRVPGGIGSNILGLLKGLVSLQSDASLQEDAEPEAPAEPEPSVAGHSGAGTHTGSGSAPPSVTLYASRAPSGPDPLRDLGWPLVNCPLPGPLMTRAWDMGLIDVPKRFDIVHAQSLAAPPARRGGLVVTVHDLTWRELPETFTSRGRRWHEAALGRALRHARAFVVSSEPVARELISSGASENVVSVIPLGCDHLPAPDFSATSQLLGRLGVQGEYLLSVCTLEPRKNLPRLLEAYALVRDRLPDPWPLVVVGPSGWGPGIERGPGVVPAGHVEAATLAGLYRRARLLAYVPLAEGFGLPPVEAMREGTPVVASTVPSVQDAAMRVDPTCVEEIADALAIVASDEDVRRQLVAAGHARAAQLTWAKTAGRHLRLWESLS